MSKVGAGATRGVRCSGVWRRVDVRVRLSGEAVPTRSVARVLPGEDETRHALRLRPLRLRAASVGVNQTIVYSKVVGICATVLGGVPSCRLVRLKPQKRRLTSEHSSSGRPGPRGGGWGWAWRPGLARGSTCPPLSPLRSGLSGPCSTLLARAVVMAGCTPSSVTPVTESSLRTFIDVANSLATRTAEAACDLVHYRRLARNTPDTVASVQHC